MNGTGWLARVLTLTLTEFRILAHLARAPRRVSSRLIAATCLRREVLERADPVDKPHQQAAQAGGACRARHASELARGRLPPRGCRVTRRSGLSRQLVLSMSAMALRCHVAASCQLLHVHLHHRDEAQPISWCRPAWTVGAHCVGWFSSATMTLLGLALAAQPAFSTGRIIRPLNSVTEACGGAPVVIWMRGPCRGSFAWRSLTALVEDFNSMAERLQRMTGELVTWNAAIAPMNCARR